MCLLSCGYVIAFAIAITHPQADTRFVVFSRDKTELNELVCTKWFETLLHHAGLVSRLEPLSSIKELPVNYEGNSTLLYIFYYTAMLFMLDCETCFPQMAVWCIIAKSEL
jgi:hypothetical protein